MKKQKEISALPVKTTLNLAITEKSRKNPISIGVFIVLLILIGVFCKFCVIDLLNKQTDAERAADDALVQLNLLKQENSDYDDVEYKYRHYCLGDLEEYGTVDRIEIMTLLETELQGKAQVSSVAIAGNTAAIKFSGMDLTSVSTLMQRVKTYDIVGGVTVYTANSEDRGEINAEVTMTITFVSEQEVSQ